ncbi:hypothetical protein BDZ85DRAFT_285769 [Elsinoe ampelina]|uniref:Uncharacterized protein n=1 Tax=Elsinoe ampelina TaxID=302913 RepID=A0A6A6G010_9PEZI|nr:hypothetical protein BDZ85DRAFT_285769 [Elsinoe ampelina]
MKHTPILLALFGILSSPTLAKKKMEVEVQAFDHEDCRENVRPAIEHAVEGECHHHFITDHMGRAYGLRIFPYKTNKQEHNIYDDKRQCSLMLYENGDCSGDQHGTVELHDRSAFQTCLNDTLNSGGTFHVGVRAIRLHCGGRMDIGAGKTVTVSGGPSSSEGPKTVTVSAGSSSEGPKTVTVSASSSADEPTTVTVSASEEPATVTVYPSSSSSSSVSVSTVTVSASSSSSVLAGDGEITIWPTKTSSVA